MLFVLLMLIATGVFFIYASNRHQLALSNPLSKKCKLLGYLLLIISVVIPPLIFSGAANIFMWLMLVMLGLIIVPISSFWLRRLR
ncbi:hypothetical protein D9981_00410 [Pseudoalteromonas phenolica O-BC30]|uniref:DUF3325 domain-containing protein n=1 Tax=Pseudoalteromonas phenolica TaxID=161398 RepID=A0A0S2K407_9GAMM|nr:hypothetical protein PP2015_2579 [Pseudoalteromonas phenolica]RXF07146.1 hypothetical protein D9981_00410 [Pseudoalteromonas phenolica O-BC30]